MSAGGASSPISQNVSPSSIQPTFFSSCCGTATSNASPTRRWKDGSDSRAPRRRRAIFCSSSGGSQLGGLVSANGGASTVSAARWAACMWSKMASAAGPPASMAVAIRSGAGIAAAPYCKAARMPSPSTGNSGSTSLWRVTLARCSGLPLRRLSSVRRPARAEMGAPGGARWPSSSRARSRGKTTLAVAVGIERTDEGDGGGSLQPACRTSQRSSSGCDWPGQIADGGATSRVHSLPIQVRTSGSRGFQASWPSIVRTGPPPTGRTARPTRCRR